MFNISTADLTFLFESAGTNIKINGMERTAIITNPQMSANEERYIHTLKKVQQGDLVSIDDEKYLIINETVSKRGGKYKSLIRHCNYDIEIAGELIEVPMLDEDGNPILNDFGEEMYEYVEGDPIFIPSIIDSQSFAVVNGAITLASNEIIVTVQNNQLNLEKFAVNLEFTVMDKEWKVTNVDKTKKGLLILSCELG